VVAGDAGIGKTRFVTEGLRDARSVWGACLPLAEKLPFLPVTEALDALSRIEDGALPAGALAAIPAYAKAEAVRLLPRLQPPDDAPRAGQRERIFSGVTELLAAAARPGGLAVVIEDVHWADGATLDFLTFLARTGRADAITVVATVRSDETPAEPAPAAGPRPRPPLSGPACSAAFARSRGAGKYGGCTRRPGIPPTRSASCRSRSRTGLRCSAARRG
jgi:predicted ATPase